MGKLVIRAGKKASLGNWQDQVVVLLDAWVADQIHAEGTGPTWKAEIERARGYLEEQINTSCLSIEENLHNGDYVVNWKHQD